MNLFSRLFIVLFSIFLLQVGLYGPACSAEKHPSLMIEQNADIVKVSGTVEGDQPYATILIVYPNKELAPIEYGKNEVADDVINEIGILEVRGGSYSSTYTMKADVPSGVYSVWVKYADDVFTDTFTYVSYNDRVKIIEELNSNKGNRISVLKTYENILPLNLETKYDIVSDELKIYTEQKLGEIPTASIDTFIVQCKKIIDIVFALDNLNKSASEVSFAENLELWADTLSIDYNKNEEKIDGFYSTIYSRLPFCSKESFNDEFEKEYFLHKINMASWGKYDDILKNSSDVTGIDMDRELKGLTNGQKESLYRTLVLESPFPDVETLQNKFKQAKSKVLEPVLSGTGKKGSGGRSSGGVVAMPAKVETEVKSVPEISKISFVDVEDVAWAEESINYLAEKNIILGMEDNKFYPRNSIKREEYIKILLNALNFSIKSYPCDAADVEKDSWYYNYIATAYKLGITTGKNESLFGIGEFITREDAAVLLSRAMSIQGYAMDEKEHGFKINDIDEISTYALDAVNKLVKANIIKGNEEGKFSPKNNITRAEASRMIYNVLINLNLGGLK